MLTIGDKFPSFDLKAVVSTDPKTAFTQVNDKTGAGKWKVVFFWPKDFTFVCPTEIAAFGKLNKAFVYDWRIYTVPELRDCILEAGFGDFEVWSEGWDAKAKRGNGVLYKRTDLDNDDTWIAYAVATR